jgi:hypothetical protein
MKSLAKSGGEAKTENCANGFISLKIHVKGREIGIP